jgi:hypothetical protein
MATSANHDSIAAYAQGGRKITGAFNAAHLQRMLLLRESGCDGCVISPEFASWGEALEVDCVRDRFGGEGACGGGSSSNNER